MNDAQRANRFARRATVAVLLLAVSLVALNVLAWSATAGFDASGRGRYSISDGAVSVLRRFTKPINVRYYISKDRPKYRASLQRDMVGRLDAIASAVGHDIFNFDADRDVVEFEDTAAASEIAARLGIKPIVENTATQSILYYSAVRIEYIDSPRPTVIALTDPRSLEYEIVAKALRLQKLRPLPVSGPAAVAGLVEPYRVTWVYGQLAPDDPKLAAELPLEKRELKAGVERVFADLHRLNPHIETLLDSDPASVLRSSVGLTSETLEQGVTDANPGAKYTISYYSQIAVENGKTRRLVKNVKSADRLMHDLTALAWDMDTPKLRVGVVQCSLEPASRPELEPNVERRIYAMMDRSPEVRIAKMVDYLDYESLKVFIDQQRFVPRDELSVLIVPRPSNLDERQRYEIEGYLAGGGTVLVLGGEWHVPLVDGGLRLNPENLEWNPGDVLWMLDARKVEGGLGPMIAKYGLKQTPGLLLAPHSNIPYRVYGAAPSTEPGAHPAPVLNPGRLGLIPFALQGSTPHALVREVESFPLRGGSTLELDYAMLEKLGLHADILLETPEDAQLWNSSDGSDAIQHLHYGRVPGPADEPGKATEFSPAGNKPVAVMLSGKFPFDANAVPPQFSHGERIPARAPGERFQHHPGRLIYVSSPDCFEELDAHGWIAGEPALVGDTTRRVETSTRRFLANVLDYATFGEELIDVRSSLLPPPSRREDYTAAERGTWTVLNVALVPAAIAAFGTLFSLSRKARRRRHEESLGNTAGRR